MGAVAKADNTLPAEATQQELQQYLTFMLGGEIFAIGILSIKEIIEYGQLTEVPRMPEFIRGVINLRGAVVPVIDLGARFGKQPALISRRTCVVIIEVQFEGEQQVVGVMVDAVNEVLDIPADQVEPAPTFGANIRADFIQGMGKVEGRFVIILNVDHVLSLDEMSTLAGIGAGTAVVV
ncbi:MAG: chemotaxis protein CheW [Methylophilaceae bacterium]|jgi:purine-binding chemotaxis protein CheW|nr:chemotaxis protein CheW [Methylophilaceae bacterium]